MLLRARQYIQRTLGDAGIEIDGSRPWDIRVHRQDLYSRVVTGGSLALGEAYMAGWWDCENLEEMFVRLLKWRARAAPKGSVAVEWPRFLSRLKRRFLNLQSWTRAGEVVDVHYDLPPHLFEAMLGETMAYSCAYWREAQTLDEAQRHKLDLICRKLEIEASDRVLDLGCGFGSFARYAAETYGCTVVGVNLSSSQVGYAREFCRGLPVEIHRCDYRNTDVYASGKPFDKIVSIAMFEAVGHKNFRTYMEIVHRLLKDQGLWLLHTLGDRYCSADPWLTRYIFPNGELPTLSQINDAILGLFHLEDHHNFGRDYCPTLAAWETNFRDRWDEIRARDPKLFDQRFFRMWVYYLGCCRAAVEVRNMYLWQTVMSKGYLATGYRSVR